MGTLTPSVAPGPPPLHWVKPPQQARSQKTLERVLDAAEEVIREKGLAAMTVSEVVRRAGSSVGAFYARFPDKDALIATLHERSCAESLATAEMALDPVRWAAERLPRVIHELVQFTSDICRERRPLLLAYIAMAASDVAYAERRARVEAGMSELLAVLLNVRKGEIAHANPRLAAAVSLRMMMGALEYGALVHRESATTEAPPDDVLVAELTRAMLRYLGVE